MVRRERVDQIVFFFFKNSGRHLFLLLSGLLLASPGSQSVIRWSRERSLCHNSLCHPRSFRSSSIHPITTITVSNRWPFLFWLSTKSTSFFHHRRRRWNMSVIGKHCCFCLLWLLFWCFINIIYSFFFFFHNFLDRYCSDAQMLLKYYLKIKCISLASRKCWRVKVTVTESQTQRDTCVLLMRAVTSTFKKQKKV